MDVDYNVNQNNETGLLESLGNMIYQAEIDAENMVDVEDEDEDGEDHRILSLDEDELEDEDVEDEGEMEEERDSNHENENEETTAPNATPSVLSAYLQKLQNRLSKEKGKEDEDRRGTFWIDPPSPFFSLKRTVLDPDHLYLPRVFVWRPHLHQELTCKYCGNVLRVKGWEKRPHARRIVDLDR
jgi:hypothetical protein